MFDKSAIVWLVLVGATLCSYLMGYEVQVETSTAALIIMLIAGIKARLIFRNFMEINSAPVVWRWLTDAWIVTCICLVLALHSGL